MNYVFVQNPQAAKPIMLLDGVIKKGDGQQFSREVLSLVSAGKKEVDVWINSKGGNASEGYSMYSSLKDSGMYVTTINQGIVDSTAGWVYQAGNKRIWASHGLGLVHEATNASGSTIEEMNDSIATMLSSRSTLTKDAMRELMRSETIITTQMAKEYGLYDEVVNCSEILEFTNSSDVTEVNSVSEKHIQKRLSTIKHMSKINEMLQLHNEASAEAQEAAIRNILSAKNEAEQKVAAHAAKIETLTETLNLANAERDEATAKLTEIENSAKLAAATSLVNEHKGKRIADKPEIVAKWTKMATEDFDGTKQLLEALNVNAQAPKAPQIGGNGEQAPARTGSTILSVSDYMTSAPVRI